MTAQQTKLQVGLVALAWSTFDVVLADDLTGRVRQVLLDSGLDLTGPADPVGDLQEAAAAAAKLNQIPPDLLVVLQSTFTDASMAVHLARNVAAPLLLWALPEERTGGHLRLNSFCGINLAAHALKREGLKYDYVYAGPDDPVALEKITTLARAGHVRRRLRWALIGRVGEHPAGFDSCKFNPERLKSILGTEIVQINLSRVFEIARQADPEQVEALIRQLKQDLAGLDELDQTAMHHTLAAYLALKNLVGRYSLDGLAVRCWPHFFTDLGGAACGAMSMLTNEMIPCGCEADINGTITQLILQWLSGEPAFGSDLVGLDNEENIAVLWHCGLAPLSMADPEVKPRGTIHSNRQMPLLMEFPLKPGPVTLARLNETGGGYRLVIGRGRILSAPPSYSGTSGLLRFERPVAEVLEIIMKEGLEHHISLTYGRHEAALSALAGMLELPVVHL